MPTPDSYLLVVSSQHDHGTERHPTLRGAKEAAVLRARQIEALQRPFRILVVNEFNPTDIYLEIRHAL